MSGREQAIEKLIDSEPHGAFYRASRILEEVVPQALSSRPNLVTRSALVEEAFKLREHEIDCPAKYRQAFGISNDTPSSSLRADPRDDVKEDRVLRHFKKQMGDRTHPIPPSLVASLRRLFDQSTLPPLLKEVMAHFEDEDEDEGKEIRMEPMIASICMDKTHSASSTKLQGFLVAILGLLTACMEKETEPGLKGPKKSVSPMPSLQVGTILALLKPQAGQPGSPFPLDESVLDYLAEAAAVYEERLEIQKERLLERMATKNEQEAHSEADGHDIPASTPDRDHPAGVAVVEDDEEEENDDDDDDDEVPVDLDLPEDDAALSAAVFEQIISAVTGDDESLDGVDRAALRLSAQEDSSDSDSTNSDEDNSHDRYEIPEDAPQIDDDSDHDINAEESDDDDDEDDDDDDEEEENSDAMLRRALALSLAEQLDEASKNSSPDTLAQSPTTTPRPEADPVEDTPKTPEDETGSEQEDPLPGFPTQPNHYLFPTVDIGGDEEKPSESNAFLDPADFEKFGSVPASYVVVRLLQNALAEIRTRWTFPEKKKEFSAPGGMGCSLFTSATGVDDSKNTKKDIKDFAVAVRLILTTLVEFNESRFDAIEGMRRAVLAEQRNAAGEPNDDDEEGGEEDDPAIVLAMHASHPSSSSLAESLETKGMTRKAAAAAQDAALRLKSLRKETNEWKNRVKLYSYCTLMMLKCYNSYVQSGIAKWLESNAHECSFELKEIIPKVAAVQVGKTLSNLLDSSLFRSYTVLVSAEDVDFERLFMASELYAEAVTCFGECVPFLYPNHFDREEALRSLVSECFKESSVGVLMAAAPPSSLPVLPEQTSIHKLEVMCRRLCVSDMLDEAVSRPHCLNLETSDQPVVMLKYEGQNQTIHPHKTSSLVELLSSSLSGCQCSALGSMSRLRSALCHKSITRGILWDGLYACSQLEPDDSAVIPAPTVGTESIRVSSTPSSSLPFDSSKCSDSIAILFNHNDSSANGSSAHQRASKVWGTVLSSTFFSPKTGVHRWAVRLDRCERGHVFVGVATAQASMRTYVGGDKYGWGVIGTQALWHDRRKIRGDYGATFRTGSVIIVTLDTDAGTLSFSSWKDSSGSSTAFSLDPLAFSSPRRQGSGSGSTEDWGVAFEGLPLDARLYPAVGLYQRDDRVTLLTVESAGRSGPGELGAGGDLFAGGLGYFPGIGDPMSESESLRNQIAEVREHNDHMSWDSVLFVSRILHTAVESIRSGDANEYEYLLRNTLPCVAAAISLLPPAIPVLSSRFALALLPKLTECIHAMDNLIVEKEGLFYNSILEGKWVIRATGSSGNTAGGEGEEYVVDLRNKVDSSDKFLGFCGDGVGTTGKSKNGIVSIIGAVEGSSLHFVEEWRDGADDMSSSDEASSSCVVAARLSLDGSKFEGTYRNVQYGTTGRIAGAVIEQVAKSPNGSASCNALALRCQSLLCYAHGHLASILGCDLPDDLSFKSTMEPKGRHSELRKLVSSNQLLAEGLVDPNSEIVQRRKERLIDLYKFPLSAETTDESRNPPLLQRVAVNPYSQDQNDPVAVREFVARTDPKMHAVDGSLSPLCESEYNTARLSVIATLLYHANVFQAGTYSLLPGSRILGDAWKASRVMVENKIRKALSSSISGASRRETAKDTCYMITTISSMLQRLEPCGRRVDTHSDVFDASISFFNQIECTDELEFIERYLEASLDRAIMRFVALEQLEEIILRHREDDSLNSRSVVECVAVSLPRLLGRGLSLLSADSDKATSDGIWRNDIGTYFMAGISGSGKNLRMAVKDRVHSILGRLGQSLRLVSDSNAGADVDSLILSILPVFAMTLRSDDISVVVQNNLLSSIKDIQYNHRQYLQTVRKSVDVIRSSSKLELIQDLKQLIQRDIARAVATASLSVGHVLSYQVSQHSGHIAEMATKQGVEYVFSELQHTIHLLKGILATELQAYTNRVEERQFERWQSSVNKTAEKSYSKKKKKDSRIGFSGFLYLVEEGSFVAVNSGAQSGSHKSGHRANVLSTSQHPPSHSERVMQLLGGPCQQHIAQCLNLLSSLLKSKIEPKPDIITSDWVDVLLDAVGVTCTRDEAGTLVDVQLQGVSRLLMVPSRFRGRILRLLGALLPFRLPDPTVIKALFLVSGSATDSSFGPVNGGDTAVGSEAIAAIRTLYSPASPDWRACIESVIKENCTTASIHSGILNFLSGITSGVGQGSYVLLKPAAAAPLSPDLQASPSTKSHGSSSSSGSSSGTGVIPHHVVGNGTQGIVAGLCRTDAAAGIVTSIDMKAGICEVVLIDRSPGDNEDLDPVATRRTMTVRALRTPLVEVAVAEEIPLVLDPSFPAVPLLEVAFDGTFDLLVDLDTLSSNDQGSVDESASISYSLLSFFRAAIILLSDERILQQVRTSSLRESLFPYVLKLASRQRLCLSKQPELLQHESLAMLPIHEARLGHYSQMLSELKFRRDLVQTVEEEVWQKRSTETAAQGESKEKGGTDGDSEVAGYTTPPSGRTAGERSEPRVAEGRRQTTSGTSGQSTSSRGVSRSSITTDSAEDEDESEAAATAAAHLREAAIAQMAELGLPRSWSEFALRRTGGTNIEAAVHFCLERGGEMERLLAEEREHERMRLPSSGSSARRRNRGESASSSHLLRQLLEMGFPRRWCTEALAATRNNVDEALTWILTNGDRLNAEDRGMQEEEDDDDDDDDDDEEIDEEVDEEEEDDSCEEEEGEQRKDAEGDEHEQEAMSSNEQGVVTCGDREDPQSSAEVAVSSKELKEDQVGTEEKANTKEFAWSGSVTPLRFISGRSIINPKTLAISGLPTGGFSSVGTKGVLLTRGKWYYEAILETAGCLQIGWADGSFSGHCHADRGDGCGDGPSSWAYDGWRRYRWHASATEWGCRWKEGDVVGCLLDLDEGVVSFTLNGRGEEIGMGKAFSGKGFRPCGGVYACVSFNRREKLRLILGGGGNEPFKHPPPAGFRGVGEAVLQCVKEREVLVEKENILDPDVEEEPSPNGKRFLCDFSDGEHGHELFAWQHRYYGSDASVHLGSGKSSKSGASSNKSSNGTGGQADSSPMACVIRRLEKEWSKDVKDPGTEGEIEQLPSKNLLLDGINDAIALVSSLYRDESLSLSVLYARKFVLHVVIAMGDAFDLQEFKNDDGVETARSFWQVIDTCVSLRSAGWVGEAGAMAVAAEALGLGISSTENQFSSHSFDRPGMASIVDVDEAVVLPSAGISQLLSSALVSFEGDTGSARATWKNLAASAEASIGSDGGGGPLIFLQQGLQSAVSKSTHLREVIIAVIRRCVRLLAVVDYSGDDSSTQEGADDEDVDSSSGSLGKSTKEEMEDSELSLLPDARLTCFLTGLLLSNPVQSIVGDESLFSGLFEAWSVGLLSASAPWRMVCALSAAGILNMFPKAFEVVSSAVPTIKNFYARLHSTVVRRVWAERAAVPVCSKYVQSMIELLASVRRAVKLLPREGVSMWKELAVDAATPFPISSESLLGPSPRDTSSDVVSCWEWEHGWVSSDLGWEVWTGYVECMASDWKAPSRSAVRTLMDGGEGPPMLREGCTVLRGLDWEEERNGDEDGKSKYEAEKAAREKEKRALEEEEAPDEVDPAEAIENASDDQQDPAADGEDPEASEAAPENPASSSKEGKSSNKKKKKKKRKLPNPKLPSGTVLSIEAWNGSPAMARRVKWNLTGREGVYRYGGDGGRFDICHVELNEKGTRVKKRYPLPESAEQCAARHGFGSGRKYSVLLRLRPIGKEETVGGVTETRRSGILEWPDFGAASRVECVMHDDGAVTLTEGDLLFGSKDSGWEARFGQSSYVQGTELVLSPSGASTERDLIEVDSRSSFLSTYEELLGSSSSVVAALRNRADGSRVRVTTEMHLLRGRRPANRLPGALLYSGRAPPPLCFDRDCHNSSLSLSRDGRTLSCVAPDSRGTAFASVGFTKGVHYWEVKLEQADIGSVYIGVAEKPTSSASGGNSFGADNSSRLDRWLGWGFVNFRATYATGAERVYGAHCHNEDTVGVLLDCDAGRISFFYDGLKYGEHILNDLGCAFENISPFGFNADGCGSGGAGQGAPSGIEGGRGGRYPAHGVVRPRALWPVIGLRNLGDRVTLSAKWSTSFGIDAVDALSNALAVEELTSTYCDQKSMHPTDHPEWFIREAFDEYQRWHSSRWLRAKTRGSGPHNFATFGLDVELDTAPIACAAACASLGLAFALLPGDRVVVKRSAGRPLELVEEAMVLGCHQGRLYYRLVSQKSEGGSLTEGGGRAWFWDESETVDNGLQLVGEGKGLGVELPLINKFRCMAPGGLRIIYEGGAVIRSDLEIFDRSRNLGLIPVDTIIPRDDVLERRVNSCGVIRYRIRFEDIGEGWISSRIRGGREEAIVEPLFDGGVSSADKSFLAPEEAAVAWYETFKEETRHGQKNSDLWAVNSIEKFKQLVAPRVSNDLSVLEYDTAVVALAAAIADFSESGEAVDCSFSEVASAVTFALASSKEERITGSLGRSSANQAAAAAIAAQGVEFPDVKSVMARVALLRAFNRRVRMALPWLSVRPSQEATAILGGHCGHGASVERAGRNKLAESMDLWVQAPSIASRMRRFRSLFFPSIKISYIESVMDATTTPTPLSHDEYELPREIRTVRVNRLKARRAMGGADARAKRKHSVFSQLQNETRSWGGAALRRGFVAKGHGGQKRAFKVKLIGEGVNDYSGPYREVFTDAMHEVVEFESEGRGSLGVLDPTPNNTSQIGSNRGLFMFSRGEFGSTVETRREAPSPEERRIRNSFSSLTMARDESSREVEESLVFLGRLVGTACRHGIPVDLPLPLNTVWDAIAEEEYDAETALAEIDFLASRQGKMSQLWWQQRMLNSFVDGLSHVLPVEVLTLLSGAELRAMLCGNPEVDVDLLKRVVEYEGYEETDDVVAYFWEALREMTNTDRKKFLQFVWARSRLPNKESDFEAPFKIQKHPGGDDTLPSASTCFFSLTLPNYSDKKVLKEKLLFAIENVCTMESDYVTNDAEVGEGWRGL